MAKAQPIDQIIENPTTPASLRHQLKTAQAIRAFASQQLQLPDNASYQSYADLGRPYLTWNVVSAAEFTLRADTECFWVVGCLSYRGFFSPADAQEHAAKLSSEGKDVFVYGVPAYSTLGWFPDPLVNSFLAYSELDLARLIFHELSHQLIYIKDDTAFNEAFATAVELEGAKRWLDQQKHPAQHDASPEQQELRKTAFRQLLDEMRQALAALYQAPLSQADMRLHKHHIQAEYASRYQVFKQVWRGYRGYDHWFEPHPGNAHLASQATYYQWVPAFRQLLKESDGQWAVFYDKTRRIGKQPATERAKMLEALSARALAPATQVLAPSTVNQVEENTQ
ncbi:putative aminopeptidase [Chitinivorax tropicus]|uniref:Putative aminopeptidase n=2 Tax=Chitinivorax tropicus TaxID=714531 RepID=A0A840MV03_9PROT|nr:putative aminopeptidase [Chitinivorax tropicus]